MGLFLPGLLLILAALPFWAELHAAPRMRTALRGVNAAASGLVIAAPLLLAQHGAATIPQQALAVVCFAATHFFGVKPPFAILLGAALSVPLCSVTTCKAV